MSRPNQTWLSFLGPSHSSLESLKPFSEGQKMYSKSRPTCRGFPVCLSRTFRMINKLMKWFQTHCICESPLPIFSFSQVHPWTPSLRSLMEPQRQQTAAQMRGPFGEAPDERFETPLVIPRNPLERSRGAAEQQGPFERGWNADNDTASKFYHRPWISNTSW